MSALDREINTDGKPINMLQTDVAINSGNSGGALFDMNGNVIGITSAKYSGSTSSGASIEGISFAIPINDALRVVYDLQQYGHVTGRAYLGVTVKDLDSTTAATYGLPSGPMIQSVEAGGCAEKAGLQQGDIIIGFNGAEISSYTDLVAALNKCHSGDTATIKVFRSGAEVDATITLDERPDRRRGRLAAAGRAGPAAIAERPVRLRQQFQRIEWLQLWLWQCQSVRILPDSRLRQLKSIPAGRRLA